MIGVAQVQIIAVALSAAIAVSSRLGMHGRPITDWHSPASSSSVGDTIRVRYHVKLVHRDTSGTYVWTGSVDGAVTGTATMELRFQEGRSQVAGTELIQTHWMVKATPESKSFEASLSGTVHSTSLKTHLSGTIMAGPGRGQQIFTDSQVFTKGTQHVLSEIEGMFTIMPPAS
jgi:hypothetical protein